MATYHEPVSPQHYVELPDALKREYEPITRLSGGGTPMHFPWRHVIVFRRPRTHHVVGYFNPNISNWMTGMREAAFCFTSKASAQLTCDTMSLCKDIYGDFDFSVEPRLVFRCPECCTSTGEPHKPGCGQDKVG